MTDRVDMAEVIASFVSIHALLIRELDRQGALSAAEFVDQLESFAKGRREETEGHGGNNSGAVLMEALVSMLRSDPPPSWTPTVIRGDKD